jgi:hypothetical protein
MPAFGKRPIGKWPIGTPAFGRAEQSSPPLALFIYLAEGRPASGRLPIGRLPIGRHVIRYQK